MESRRFSQITGRKGEKECVEFEGCEHIAVVVAIPVAAVEVSDVVSFVVVAAAASAIASTDVFAFAAVFFSDIFVIKILPSPFFPVMLKLENLQPTGSFKIRGIGRTCQTAIRDGANLLVGSSGGNAGTAMAYVSERTGVPLSLFVPKSTQPMMVDLLKVGRKINLFFCCVE